ncbi:MAG TPA: response regulator transcription factor [Smithellaceae bacterium]|jgi:DNA-binding NarL/FixJ family response regulator|nr:response regulator transcription factor [Syntrophaceae bacterium]NMC92136.1 response regulator transcription factor [Smithella sp.]OQC73917.1 MAG: Oxygen regulatory protein NreC [Deltaproteobacteria bacterium ADurb.Bin002]HNV57772.1 response regulator transcription factor [Smithellaceae bacterium]MBP8666442.1 response regulator transcription factor [Syntrophaceae bacterium]
MATAKTPPKGKHRIFIVDDHPIFRQGLAQLINQESDLCVCGEADDYQGALRAVAELNPDMVIVDITLKDMSGIDLIKEVRKLNRGIIMLVISMHDESLYAERALRAGARGYVMKQEASESIVQAIRQVRIGGIYVSPRMTEQMLSRFVEGPLDAVESPLKALTDREMEVFHLIGEGLGISEIGLRLHLSVKTIGTYRERIKEKLNLRNSTELLRHAFNWVENEREAKQ